MRLYNGPLLCVLRQGGISDPTHDLVFSSIIKPSSVLFHNEVDVVDITGTERRSDTDATTQT